MPLLKTLLLGLTLVARAATSVAAEEHPSAAEAAYTRTITQRAEKIVAAMELADSNQVQRVRDIVVRQYRDLRRIHDARDARLQTIPPDAANQSVARQAVLDEAKPQLDQLHGEFLGRLAAELKPEQIEQIKDGLTYGVAPNTYAVYLKMYPDLTAEQKQQVKAWLTEARELAMDGSTADEKHAIFGKYKGKINNYLSKAGYHAKQAEQNLKQPAPPTSNPPPK